MPVCSYLVIPREGRLEAAARRLAALPGCDVTTAPRRELIILVTETDGGEAEEALRRGIEEMEEIQALLLTFAEIVPDAAPAGARPPLPTLP